MAIKKSNAWLRCSCGRKSKSAQSVESAYQKASKEGWSKHTNKMKQDTFKCPSCTHKIKKMLSSS